MKKNNIKRTKLNVEELGAINPNSIVTKKIAGKIIEILYLQHRNYTQTIKLLAGTDEYIVISTGEIKTYKKSEKRIDHIAYLRKTFKDLRDLLNANLTDDVFSLFVTLTYKENMQDTKKLLEDLKKITKKLRYYCSKNRYGRPEYITVIEPQARGAWHAHIFYIWSEKPPYITNRDISSMWGHGFTHTKWVDNSIENLGAYFTAYFTDLPIEEYDKEISDEDVIEKEVEVDGKTTLKKFIKGGRLAFYPANFHIFRVSKGIKRPIVTEETYAEATAGLSESQKTYEDAYLIEKDDFSNIVRREYYQVTSSGGEAQKSYKNTLKELISEAEEVILLPNLIKLTFAGGEVVEIEDQSPIDVKLFTLFKEEHHEEDNN